MNFISIMKQKLHETHIANGNFLSAEAHSRHTYINRKLLMISFINFISLIKKKQHEMRIENGGFSAESNLTHTHTIAYISEWLKLDIVIMHMGF